MKPESKAWWRVAQLGAVLMTGLMWLQPVSAVAPTLAQIDAARVLTQATFGPTREEIDRTVGLGTVAWIDEQLKLPPSLHLPPYQERSSGVSKRSQRHFVWWERSIRAPDQLRQRVAFALSEILVVSEKSDIDQDGLSDYYDILVRNAFGNFRTLLGEMALSPAMGRYLSMLGNRKPDPETGIRADENFAREIMQLFSIGLLQLNGDGSRKLDGTGQPIPTYSQADIENLARIFTGWHWAGMSSFDANQPNWLQPMQAYPDFHDTDAKRFMNQDFPAGRAAGEELQQALDILFQHPNVGPFVSRLLIQRLVTSNPMPEYVTRVASVFNDNGQGVRGDLKAVVRAILLDAEARAGHTLKDNRFKPPSFGKRAYGKIREPVLRLSHLWRAFHAPSVGPVAPYPFDASDAMLRQGPLTSPSVFNFFSPDYSPSAALRATGYRAPEMQLVDEPSIAGADNFMASAVFQQYLGNPQSDPNAVRIDLSYERSIASNVPALLDHLNLVLMNGAMDQPLRNALTSLVNQYKMPKKGKPATSDWQSKRVTEAVYMIVVTPDYLVQR